MCTYSLSLRKKAERYHSITLRNVIFCVCLRCGWNKKNMLAVDEDGKNKSMHLITRPIANAVTRPWAGCRMSGGVSSY